MIEIFPNLWIGNEHDYYQNVRANLGDWRVIHACKEPFHRQALGYAGRAVEKTHPEYLIAVRGNRLILNLIDAPNPDYIPQKIIDRALGYIHESLMEQTPILVHCNEGRSRSPSIGLLYLVGNTDVLPDTSLGEAEAVFKEIYPPYQPKSGMRRFMQRNWDEYTK